MQIIKKVIIVLFLLFLFSSLTKNIFNYQKKLSFYESFKKDYENEKRKNLSLKTEILKKSGPNEVEKIIRNKLNLSKPEETTIILPEPSPTPIIISPTPIPNWQQWLKVFVKN